MIGVIKGDTRSLDYSSYRALLKGDTRSLDYGSCTGI